MNIETLHPYIQKYSWGDPRWLQELLGYGEDAFGETWAELWLGTHGKGMTMVTLHSGRPCSLAEYLNEHPAETIGEIAWDACEDCLPFLFKILAVGKPLSIQCHPTRAQAGEGFKREEQQGIPIDSPERNYRDVNHKPEILCALTPFTALCGFRPLDEVISLFSRYLPEVYHLLFGSYFETEQISEETAYRYLLESVLRIGGSERAAAMQLVRNSLASIDDASQEIKLIRKFLELYPDDLSVLAPLYLQIVNLEPGEALYQPAGELHAYVEGIGVELMANSDNVLRGGLTEKHIDTDELLRVVRCRHALKHKTHPFREPSGRMAYHTPAQDFELCRSDAGTFTITGRRFVEIVIQTAGQTHFSYSEPSTGEPRTYTLNQGSACIIPAAVSSYTAECTGTAFTAGIPEESARQ